MIGAHPHLVGPQDLGSVLARLALDLRVDLLEPGAYLRFGLLVGAPERLLRAEAPAAQVARPAVFSVIRIAKRCSISSQTSALVHRNPGSCS